MVFQCGGFYSAEDADSVPSGDSTVKKEGAFCVWTQAEIRDILSDRLTAGDKADATEADVFCHHFDVRVHGNLDPYQVKTI